MKTPTPDEFNDAVAAKKLFDIKLTKNSGATHKYKVSRRDPKTPWPSEEHLIWMCDGFGNFGGRAVVMGDHVEVAVYVD